MKLLYKNFNLFQTSVPCLILPTNAVSYKILSFPFELKNPRLYGELAKTGLEELIPLSIDGLYIAVNKISKNKILIEYFKKEFIEKVFTEDEVLNNLRKKQKIRIYTPFFLLHSYLKLQEQINNALTSGKTKISVLWKSEKNGVSKEPSKNTVKLVYLNGELEEIDELNKLNPISLNTGNSDSYSSIFDLTIIEPDAAEIALDHFLKSKKRVGLNLEQPKYVLYNGGLNGGKSEGIDAKFQKYFKKTAAASLSILILSSAYLYLNGYYKFNEIKTVQSKISGILTKYYPGQKIFYEPKYDVKSYYDKLSSSNYSGKEGKDLLNFLKYVSKFKNGRVNIELKNIGYSFGEINFSGKTENGEAFNELMSYLKNKYKTVKVLKSSGKNFDILIKLNNK